MIRLSHSLALFGSLVLVLAAARAAEQGPLAPVLQTAIDKHIVGGAVALIADKDHVLDLEAVGNSNLTAKTPMQTDNLFWIASMTKSFTGAALMMLVDEGKVTLDDPVEKFLPEFKGQMVAEAGKEPHPPQHPITVREIMDHTSGLISAGDKTLKHQYVLKDTVAQIAARPLMWEPGTKFQYNNSGIETGARIIEVLSGMPYADFMQERLFTPLELKDTTFWPREEQGKRLANTARMTGDKSGLEDVAQAKDLTPAAREKFSEGQSVPTAMINNFGIDAIFRYVHHYAEGAGGLESTASDVGRFCQMLLQGGTWQGKRYLSAAAVKQMSSIQTGDVQVNPQEGYGVGVFVTKNDAQGPAIGSFGHRGARKTNMWIDPKNGLVMVLMVQSMDMTGDQQKELYNSFFKAAVEKYGKKGN